MTGHDHVLHRGAHLFVFGGDGAWWLNLEDSRVANKVDRLLGMNTLENLGHVVGAWDEDFSVVGGVSQEGSET